MQVDVLITANNADELFFTGKTTVVIDVLRASSSIVTALSNGAREIVPVDTIEFAMKVSGTTMDSGVLLAGERNAKKIDGFALGNSPLEFTEEVVSGKSIVLFTTNGTKSMVKAKFSENLVTGCFNNISAIVNYLANLGNDVVLFCAGTDGRLSLEDCACAGMIIEGLKADKELTLDDAGNASYCMYKKYADNIGQMMRESRHGQRLIELGNADDLDVCSAVDTSENIPVFSNGNFKLKR